MVIAILMAALLLLALAGMVLGAAANAREGATRAPDFISMSIGLVLGLAAAGLAVYCVQSLRFPDRRPLARGFEALMTATPVDDPPAIG